VFASAFAVDWAASRWTLAVTQGRVLTAAILSCCCAALAFAAIAPVLADWWLLIPAMLGHGLGTASSMMVARAQSRSRAKQAKQSKDDSTSCD